MSEGLIHTGGLPEDGAGETTVTPPSPPGYELLDEIGHGGMGVVYRARDVALDRDVAVKLLSERYAPDSVPAQRFLSEARITGQLQHPGIPAVHQVGALADGRPFLAMKLIKGSTLEVILKQSSDPSAERGRLLAIFEAVCQAVGYAHAHRVIHRDLKPANVMVGAFGEVQVMDWGLAKVLGEETPNKVEALAAEQTQAWTQVSPTPESGSHTQAGSLIGTPAFIPPEQAGGEIERVNELADVFGLGALLTVILTGKPPYVGETFESVRLQALRGKLEDCFARLDGCGAEPELVALCKKCLAFEPADRPADAGAVAAAVAGLRAAADERARRAEVDRARAETQTREERKRRRVQRALAACLLAVAIGAVLAAVWIDRARRSADASATAATTALGLEAEARQAEALARQQAQEATTEARQRLTRLHLATGVQAEARKEPFTALLWYARAWQQDTDPRNEAAHRTRLAAVLAGVPRLAGVCFHDTGVDDVDIDPRGTRLVTRTAARRGERGHAAYVWDFAAGKLAAPPLSHDGPVRYVGFSPDGSLILTASEDGTGALWDAPTGKRLHILPHAAPVVGATFAPDGKTVACAAGKQVVWWDRATGKPAREPIECPDEVWALELNGDGRRLLTADRGGNARVWEVATGKPAGPPLPQRVPDADDSRFYKMGPALSPDGMLVLTATAGERQARASEANTGKLLWEVPSFGQSVRWTADGRHAVVESNLAQILVDPKRGNIVQRFYHPRQAAYAATSADGQLLAAGISGGAIYLWDITSGQLRGQPFKCADFLRRLRVSADGRWLVAASQDGTARVWDLSAAPASAPYRNDCGRAQVPVYGDGSSNSPDGRAHIRPGPDGGVLERHPVATKLLGHPGPVKASRFSADGTRLATFAGSAVRV